MQMPSYRDAVCKCKARKYSGHADYAGSNHHFTAEGESSPPSSGHTCDAVGEKTFCCCRETCVLSGSAYLRVFKSSTRSSVGPDRSGGTGTTYLESLDVEKCIVFFNYVVYRYMLSLRADSPW